jgi:hypothetical protein
MDSQGFLEHKGNIAPDKCEPDPSTSSQLGHRYFLHNGTCLVIFTSK